MYFAALLGALEVGAGGVGGEGVVRAEGEGGGAEGEAEGEARGGRHGGLWMGEEWGEGWD